MNNRWLGSIVVGSVVLTAWLLWGASIPLGVPGEWTWARLPGTVETLIGSVLAIIAGAIYVALVLRGRSRIEERGRWGAAGQVAALAVAALAWLWAVQETVPPPADLGKDPYVLYYPRSSGYFWQARHDVASTAEFLSGYEELLAQQDYLHIGTHPPGLTLGYRGLLAVCESAPQLCDFVLAISPQSFRESMATIGTLSAQSGRPLTRVDQAALWLAALLTLIASAATVVGIYVLMSRHWPRRVAWTVAGLWPLVPAIAVFHPKSDTLFPLIAVVAAALWFTANDRRSLALATAAGCVLWMGITLSLAFLTIGALMAVTTLWEWWCVRRESAASSEAGATQPSLVKRRALLLLAGAAGFILPTIVVSVLGRINLLNVWRWNFANHALFYEHNVRTWWQWLLVNPLELAMAVGLPITVIACFAVWRLIRRDFLSTRKAAGTVGFLVVWGLLWISGKNMGEAARLWILLMPWVVMTVAPVIDAWPSAQETESPRSESLRSWKSPVAMILAAQMVVCVLTVQRIDGFHFTEIVAENAAVTGESEAAFATVQFAP